jgi:hypothetical protein
MAALVPETPYLIQQSCLANSFNQSAFQKSVSEGEKQLASQAVEHFQSF